MVYELAKSDQRIFFIGSDLGVGTLEKFKNEIPDRFFMEGISEANIIGMAAGLAMEGKIVYINTIATFITRRCFEQNVLDLGLHNTNVRLLGSGGGLVYAPLGPTHQATEDIAIMRAIPNMTVIAPADSEEMRRLMPQTVDHPGPIYIRLGKGGDPIVTPANEPFRIGKVIPVRSGKDILILSTGITLKFALEAAKYLETINIDTAILHVPTIKPLDIQTLIQYMNPVKVIVTIEEHSIIGGLGSAVAEILSEANYKDRKLFKRIGLPDEFPEKYGSQDSLMNFYKINTDTLISTVKGLVRINNS
jgi:transketolase